ncbi:unnamed protein product, partial [Laminaria digitata]
LAAWQISRNFHCNGALTPAAFWKISRNKNCGARVINGVEFQQFCQSWTINYFVNAGLSLVTGEKGNGATDTVPAVLLLLLLFLRPKRAPNLHALPRAPYLYTSTA